MGRVVSPRGFIGTGVSPERVHGYRCQSTEDSWVQVSDQRGFTCTGVNLKSVHGYMC
jgi:hypothetical protein